MKAHYIGDGIDSVKNKESLGRVTAYTIDERRYVCCVGPTFVGYPSLGEIYIDLSSYATS